MTSDAKVEEVEEVAVEPQELDPVQVEARAYFTRDGFSEPLDKEEVLKNVEERKEERKKFIEEQEKKAEKAAKSDKKSDK